MSRDPSGKLKVTKKSEKNQNNSNILEENVKNSLRLQEKFNDLESHHKNQMLESRFSRKSKNTSSISRQEEEDVRATPIYKKNPKNLILNLPIEKKNKQSTEREKIKNVSLEREESKEAIERDDKVLIIDQENEINKQGKLSSFESFSRKEEAKVSLYFKNLI